MLLYASYGLKWLVIETTPKKERASVLRTFTFEIEAQEYIASQKPRKRTRTPSNAYRGAQDLLDD